MVQNMIKEYINKLSDENRQDLEKLEKQMKDLLQELSCAEEWSESLQIQNNSQRNIFSPRNVDTEIESKIEKTQLSIQKIRKEIEYVRDLIETHIKKKEEYEQLLSEIEDSEKNGQYILKEKSESSVGQSAEESIGKSENIDEFEKTDKFENTGKFEHTGELKNTDKSKDNEQIKVTDESPQQDSSKEYFLNILSEIYSKTERCLALLNSDKNRCKKELLEIKTKIKKCAEEIPVSYTHLTLPTT